MLRISSFLWVAGAMLGACAAESTELADPGALAQTAEVAPRSPARRGGASTTPIAYDDPDLRCYALTAYRAADRRGEKYGVPSRPDFYVGFNIKAPWTGKQYVKSFRAIIDNKRVLHHWILYRNLNGGNETIFEDVAGTHPEGEMLFGWAPGADDLWFHEDVGMELPGGTVFQLETHYNNLSGAEVPDASGVEVCVTPNRPEHVAGMSFLGEDRIAGAKVTGNCTHESPEPVHLVLGLPHMHMKGRHMKVDLTRASGEVRTIHDLPFDFNYQRSYLYDDVVLAPGDKLSTTCTYSEPARLGKGTNDEMCYFFAVHWPAGALARKNLFQGFHGPNTCIDL